VEAAEADGRVEELDGVGEAEGDFLRGKAWDDGGAGGDEDAGDWFAEGDDVGLEELVGRELVSGEGEEGTGGRAVGEAGRGWEDLDGGAGVPAADVDGFGEP
jgi:hypothetical protein